MKYLSIQTFQCGISVSGAATFTGGATINLLALNGATTSSEASLFLGAHSALEGGQLVLQKGTSQTYAAHIDNYSDQFRVMYGTNTGSAGVALAVSLATRQLILPAYTSDTSFSGSPAGYLAFDSAGNIITTSLTLSGFVPTSRTLTINGVSYDLSANRSWTIATVGYTSKLQHQVKAGVSITKGQAVYVTSADGTNMIVGLASNVSEATSSKTMGLLDATVSTNGFANVITEGLLDGLDTSTAGAAGDPVWLGTGGNLIYGLGSKPYAPAHLVFIGIVTRKNASNGEIFVKVQNGFELKEIHDVDLFTTTPVNGHILGFDGTLWVNKTVASWLGYTPASASGTTNYISKFTGSSALGNSQIYDDGSNVGIGTTTPTQKLEVSGGIIGGPVYTTSRFIVNSTANPGIADISLGSYVGGSWLNTPGGTTGYLSVAGSAAFSYSSTNLIWYTDSGGGISEKMRITAAGNVGIGTTSPSYKLQVESSTNASIAVVGAAGYQTALELKGVDQWYRLISQPSSNGYRFDIYNQTLGAFAFSIASNLDVYLYGNVGIGTTAPAKILDIAIPNAAHANYGIRLNSVSGYGGASLYHDYGQGNGSTVFKIANDYGDARINLVQDGYNSSGSPSSIRFFTAPFGGGDIGVERVRFASDGNVGIGTSSPSYKLDVVGEGKVTGKFRVGGAVMLAEPGTGVLLFGSEGGNQTAIYSASAEAIRINTAGLVGIGTTNPQYKLDVNGIGNFSNGFSNPSSETGYRLKFYDNGGTYNDAGIGLDGSGGGGEVMWFNGLGGFYWGLGTSGTKMKLDSSGNLGIGTTSPSYKLDVSGALRATGTVYSDNGSLAGALNLGQVVSIGSSFGSYANLIFTMHNGGGFSDIMKLQGNGNVGIGTNSPTKKLHVYTADNEGIFLQGAGGGVWMDIQASGGQIHSVGAQVGGMGIYNRTSSSYRMFIADAGNFGIGNTSPSTLLDVSGVITATGGNSTNWNTAYGWGNHSSAGYVPQARTLTINGTSYDLSANRSWTIATTTPGGSDTQFQYNSSGSLAGASALTYNSTTNRVGINQASPGYDLDVNGQVRVQDKLRVGTVNSGNGVVHMSSSATINANTTTIVWAQNVSVGMCAFIEYYILNGNTFTDQRAGTIIVTWNQTGTPTIAHTETTTPDIGSTTTINFTSTLVGSDARINAVSSSPHPYTMVMSYKYF